MGRGEGRGGAGRRLGRRGAQGMIMSVATHNYIVTCVAHALRCAALGRAGLRLGVAYCRTGPGRAGPIASRSPLSLAIDNSTRSLTHSPLALSLTHPLRK